MCMCVSVCRARAFHQTVRFYFIFYPILNRVIPTTLTITMSLTLIIIIYADAEVTRPVENRLRVCTHSHTLTNPPPHRPQPSELRPTFPPNPSTPGQRTGASSSLVPHLDTEELAASKTERKEWHLSPICPSFKVFLLLFLHVPVDRA